MSWSLFCTFALLLNASSFPAQRACVSGVSANRRGHGDPGACDCGGHAGAPGTAGRGAACRRVPGPYGPQPSPPCRLVDLQTPVSVFHSCLLQASKAQRRRYGARTNPMPVPTLTPQSWRPRTIPTPCMPCRRTPLATCPTSSRTPRVGRPWTTPAPCRSHRTCRRTRLTS
jgi:hypothetical protein